MNDRLWFCVESSITWKIVEAFNFVVTNYFLLVKGKSTLSWLLLSLSLPSQSALRGRPNNHVYLTEIERQIIIIGKLKNRRKKNRTISFVVDLVSYFWVFDYKFKRKLALFLFLTYK